MASSGKEGERGDLDALVPKARAGDREAVEALLLALRPELQAYLRRRSGTRLHRMAELADLEQEVCASLVGELHRLRAEARLEDFRALLKLHAGWVLGKVGRRASSFAGESVVEDGAGPSAPEESVGPVTRGDLQDHLRARIDRLGETDSRILVGYLEGRSFEELGSELGLSGEAVRKRFSRASARLAEPSGDSDS